MKLNNGTEQLSVTYIRLILGHINSNFGVNNTVSVTVLTIRLKYKKKIRNYCDMNVKFHI